MPFYHFDAYHLKGIDDFYELGFEEYLENGGVVLIEWASVISNGFPDGSIHVEIVKGADENERQITFFATDHFHRKVLEEWQINEDSCL
jgi:tRNA threonylcarbamoyladenosine biosynthesis protein TsaE